MTLFIVRRTCNAPNTVTVRERMTMFLDDYEEQVSTAVGQAAACAPVTQRARVRSPVGTGFLGEVFFGVFLTCKTNVGKL